MARAAKAIDVRGLPELLRLAEEVADTNEPRMLRRGAEDLAVLVPAVRSRPRSLRGKAEADYKAFRSAAGSWSDVDTDSLIADTLESRRGSSRPPVEL